MPAVPGVPESYFILKIDFKYFNEFTHTFCIA